MSTLTLVATEPLNASTGALLDAGDPYVPELTENWTRLAGDPGARKVFGTRRNSSDPQT